ncbi:MAG: mercury methylation corrinoid protein HgcA [Nitrospirota bacterium]|nr:mercury methylation corrinoid protein HgcA [Nitrospirota bacterium]
MQEIKFIKTEGTPNGSSSCCGTSGQESAASCCSTTSQVQSFVIGSVTTAAGPVPKIVTTWTSSDTWGMVRSRSGGYRMRYTVEPGLYAVGEPTPDSDVFVTANYKLTFDILRRSLAGMNAWVLALDTKSINVWCAAGKGTFGTEELATRISAARLSEVVAHRKLILPQLGAVGVNAAEIRKRTGFRVAFGPVEARDIPAYVRGNYKKTPEMRTIRFSLLDRMILTPMELNPALQKYPWFALAVLLLFGFQPSGILFRDAFFGGLPFLALGLVAVFAGAFLTPVLLPFVPFRSFALKGLVMGVAALAALEAAAPSFFPAGLMRLAAYLLFPALTSYLALQFTGATTYTGMSGVKKELKLAVPAYFAASGLSVLLVIAHKFQTWRMQ